MVWNDPSQGQGAMFKMKIKGYVSEPPFLLPGVFNVFFPLTIFPPLPRSNNPGGASPAQKSK